MSGKLNGNSLGASGFTLSILAIISLGWFGLICSVLGGVFCAVQLKNKETKLAKAGLIISVAAFVLSIIWIIYIGPIVDAMLKEMLSNVSA